MKINILSIFCIVSLTGCGNLVNKGEIGSTNKIGMTTPSIESASFKFERISNKSKITFKIYWINNPEGEYSNIGPIVSMVVCENGQVFRRVKKYNINSIEDVKLDSIKLRSPKFGEYKISMNWGVGEDLHYPNLLTIY